MEDGREGSQVSNVVLQVRQSPFFSFFYFFLSFYVNHKVLKVGFLGLGDLNYSSRLRSCVS